MAKYNNEHYNEPFPTNFRELLVEEAEKRKNNTYEKIEEKGIQKSIADICGVSQQMISKYSTGESKPDYLNLVKIAKYFGVNVGWLLGMPNVPKKMVDLDKQATLQYTGLSETLLDAVMEANRRSKDALSLLLIGTNLRDLQRAINLFKNVDNLKSVLHLYRGKKYTRRSKDAEKEEMLLYHPYITPIEIDVTTLFDIELHRFLDELFVHTSARMGKIYKFIFSHYVDGTLTRELIEKEKSYLIDQATEPILQDILEESKGELYGNTESKEK